MVDKSTVMGWLEGLTQDYWPQWYSDSEVQKTAKAALALLKDQEPKTVLRRDDGYYCPWCSTITTRTMGAQKLHLGTRYCPYCGQAVKWK